MSQEVGWAIANLMTYIDEALKKGVKIEELVPKTNLHMTTDNDLFEEVAKFRAVRRLWAKIARERYGTNDPRVLSIRITVYTASNRLTAQQPLNNIIRTTIHALASMLGGVETMSIPAYDEAHALPTAESTRLASLIPHVLTDENMVGNTADPLAGSYYIEWLTDKIEEGGRRCYDDVEAMGGGLAAIESGYFLRETTEGMYKYQQEVRKGLRNIIGVNKYAIEQEEPIELFKNNPKEEMEQVKRLKKIKKERDNKVVEKCLAEVRRIAENKVAGKNQNIVPSILESVEAYATVGEIFGTLREVFGEYKLPMII